MPPPPSSGWVLSSPAHPHLSPPAAPSIALTLSGARASVTVAVAPLRVPVSSGSGAALSLGSVAQAGPEILHLFVTLPKFVLEFSDRGHLLLEIFLELRNLLVFRISFGRVSTGLYSVLSEFAV